MLYAKVLSCKRCVCIGSKDMLTDLVSFKMAPALLIFTKFSSPHETLPHNFVLALQMTIICCRLKVHCMCNQMAQFILVFLNLVYNYEPCFCNYIRSWNVITYLKSVLCPIIILWQRNYYSFG